MANHPLIKDVEKWIVDSFSFMDGIGYDVEFDDEEIKNTNIIVADIDGLTDSDFEKGKKNLLKSISNKIKAEFPYLWIHSDNDGYYLIMYVVLADNNRFFKIKDIPYINLNESKESTRKSLKEEKEVWIIKSKDDLQYVGKKIFDVCEDIENARKFKSKFEAEEFLKKHDKALDYRYWKVINIVSESKESVRKSIKESKDITIEEFISDYKNNDCFSIRDKENGHESECFWGSKKDVLDSDYRLFTVLDTDVNKETDDTILYIDLEENAWVESKKSARKSIKEGRIDKGAVVYEFGCMLNRLGYLCYDYSNESNNEKCDEIVYMIMDLLKTMPKA